MWSWNHSIRSLFRRLGPRRLEKVRVTIRWSCWGRFRRKRWSVRPEIPAFWRCTGAPAKSTTAYLAAASGRSAAVANAHAGGVFFHGVRLARLHADLFRRPGRALGRSSEGLERRAAAAGGRGSAVSEGLLPANARSRRLAAGTHAGERFLLASGHAGHRRRRRAT